MKESNTLAGNATIKELKSKMLRNTKNLCNIDSAPGLLEEGRKGVGQEKQGLRLNLLVLRMLQKESS